MGNTDQLFDKYLHNELTATEKVAFESQLVTDSEFKKDFQLHQLLVKSIVEVGNENLKKDLNQLHDDQEKQFKKRFGFYVFLIALIGLGSWLMALKNDQHIQISKKPIKKKVKAIQKVIKPKIKTPPTPPIVELKKAVQKPLVKPQIKPKRFELMELPPKLVRQAEFTNEPQYMYFKNTVHLVGWNDLLPAQIDLRIHKNKLYLFVKNTYYELKENSTWTVLKKRRDTRNFGTLQFASGKAKKIGVLIHPMKVERSSRRVTLYSTDSLPTTRWYKLKNDKLVLSLKASVKVKKSSLVAYKNQLYLRTASKMYLLNADAQPQLLQSTTIADWQGKKIIELYIEPKYLNFEDMYDLQQSN